MSFRSRMDVELPVVKYTISTSGQADTSTSDVIAVEAGPGKKFKLLEIIIWQEGAQTLASIRTIQVIRTTAPGTGGVVVPARHDLSDPPFTGIARVKPSALGAAGDIILNIPIQVDSTLDRTAPIVIDLRRDPIIVAPGAGIAIRDPGATGATAFAVSILITEQ